MLSQMTKAYREGYFDGQSGAEHKPVDSHSSVADAIEYNAGYEKGQQDREFI